MNAEVKNLTGERFIEAGVVLARTEEDKKDDSPQTAEKGVGFLFYSHSCLPIHIKVPRCVHTGR